jgi:hypothetical protein
VEDVELETLIDQRTATLVRQLDAGSGDMRMGGGGVRTQMAVQFFEKKRRKAWFGKGEEEICWEAWTLDVTLATPRTESGKSCHNKKGLSIVAVLWRYLEFRRAYGMCYCCVQSCDYCESIR